jgi:hypothetical protein
MKIIAYFILLFLGFGSVGVKLAALNPAKISKEVTL